MPYYYQAYQNDDQYYCDYYLGIQFLLIIGLRRPLRLVSSADKEEKVTQCIPFLFLLSCYLLFLFAPLGFLFLLLGSFSCSLCILFKLPGTFFKRCLEIDLKALAVRI